MASLSEDHKEIASGKKKDDEGYMARLELDTIEKAVKVLRKNIKNSNQQLPAWVQSKITKAADHIDTVADYLSSDEELDEYYVDTNPKYSSSLTERILAEMGCDCDMKPHKSVEQIAKIHKTSVERIQKQLKRGIKVEMEHTIDKNEAESIALQHLEERPDYYIRLQKAEKGGKLNESSKGGSLHRWFRDSESDDNKPGWVQPDGSPCANEPGETKTPKCFSRGRLEALKRMGKEGKAIIRSAVRRKRKEDKTQQQKTGGASPTNVPTFVKGRKNKNYVKPEPTINESYDSLDETRDIKGKGSGKKDACYHKVRSRYNVWPSAYASGALVKCRKVGAANWGTKSEEYLPEGVRIQSQSGQLMNIMLNWRNRIIITQLFFPQVSIPKKREVLAAVEKVYPDAKVISFRVSQIDPKMPLIQVNEEGPSLSVGRGEKLPVSKGGGLTAKGRERYNRATGSNLQAPVTGKVKRGSKAWKRRRNFCSRSRSWKGPRGLAARRRWKC